MIDFNARDGQRAWYKGELTKHREAYHREIRELLREEKKNNYKLGNALKVLWETCAEDICYARGGEFKAKHFFGYLEVNFDLAKTTVWTLINVVDEFGDPDLGDYAEQWQLFSYSALVEMLTMLPSQRRNVKPSWSVREIRDYKKRLVGEEPRRELQFKDNGRSETDDADENDGDGEIIPLEADLPEYVRKAPNYRFYMSQPRETLVTRIVDLEHEQRELFRIITESGIQINKQ